MKIHFCDLCNESVPDSHLSQGLAYLRKGRVVCAACENSMGGDQQPAPAKLEPASAKLEVAVEGAPSGEGLGAAPLNVGVTQPVLAPTHKVSSARTARKSGSQGIGILALLLVVGLGAYIKSELDLLHSTQERQGRIVDDRLLTLGSELDDVSRRARDRNQVSIAELYEKLDGASRSTREELVKVRAELARETGKFELMRQELSQLQLGLRESEADAGARLDELVARTMQSRRELDDLGKRLSETELAIAEGAVSRPVAAAAPAAPPKYQSELADLASENAGTRWNAVGALGDTQDPAVIEYLVPVLQDDDVFVRMAVARVLGDLAAPDAIEPLIGALEDEEAVVREASMVALHGITGRNFHFDPMGKSGERAKKVKAWRTWWKNAREQYFGEV